MGNTDYLTCEIIKQKQNDNFSNVINHIISTPLYNRKYSDYGIRPSSIKSIDSLSKLPFIYKDDLREISIFERSPIKLEEVEFIFSSSGSSGEPTDYLWSRTDSNVLQIASKRALSRIDIYDTDMAIILAPLGMQIMWYCMLEQYRTNNVGVVTLGLSNPQKIFQAMKDYNISIIATLPTVASGLYEYLVKQGEERIIDELNLRQFHFGGDYLSSARRNRIEESWKTECFNFFGMSEIFGPFAGECKCKDGMHFLSDYIYLEVLDPVTKTPVEPGTPGVAVYTTLWQKGSPLIRYWSNDFVIEKIGPCACGRNTARIYYLGRPENMFYIKDRKIFTSQIEEILFKYPVGNEFKIIIKEKEFVIIVEEYPGGSVPVNEIKNDVEKYSNTFVKIDVVKPGSLTRQPSKAFRVEDQRIISK